MSLHAAPTNILMKNICRYNETEYDLINKQNVTQYKALSFQNTCSQMQNPCLALTDYFPFCSLWVGQESNSVNFEELK